MTIYYNKASILSPKSWPLNSLSLGYVKLEVVGFTCFGAIGITHEHNAFSLSNFVVYGVMSLF
jgi:hypothetical protein